MKRFLSAGEGYGLLRKHIITLFLVALLGAGPVKGHIALESGTDTITRQVHGWVLTALSQKSVEGARVEVVGTGDLTYTDQDGYFRVPAANVQDKVLVSHYNHQDTLVPYNLDRRSDLHIQVKPDMSDVTFLIPGDNIPDSFWDLPVSIANHPEGRTWISLREYSHHRLIILYTWATWCKPCVETIERWNALWPKVSSDVMVFPVHLSREQYGRDMVGWRDWHLPVLVGDACYKLERYFFSRTFVGSTVVIRDGQFLGISSKKVDDLQILEDLLAGRDYHFTMRAEVTHEKKGAVK